MTKDEALKLALEVMHNQGDVGTDDWIAAEKAIKEALAAPEQEPMHPEIKKMYEDFFDKCFRESPVIKAALAAPPKKWTSLTNEDRRIIDNNYLCQLGSVEHFKAVEEKLRELNQ
jgi:ubiquinone/menaquinone biosynthesis C-methylase UbiE